jgi:capsular polysaccharide biosynthesis protein
MRLEGRLRVLAGTVAGLVAAVALTLLQSSTYRADASIALVRQGQPPGSDPALAQAAEAAAELFHSRAVAEPAIANLRLDDSPDELLDRVSVETEAESSLIRISVEAPSRDEARRTAQELTELATVLFNDRFGPETAATVWEAPRADEDRVSPRPARNLALGALLGALVGWAVSLLGLRRPRPILRVRRQPRATPEPKAAEPVPALVVAEPVQVAPVARAGQATGPFVMPGFGQWTVADVERLLAEHGPAFPDRREELAIYLDSFRGVADADGRLPGNVDLVIEDVFAELIDRVPADVKRARGT